jgi:hypothetical protein
LLETLLGKIFDDSYQSKREKDEREENRRPDRKRLPTLW